jgi:hypothetical protein
MEIVMPESQSHHNVLLARLRERIGYVPETGYFFWRIPLNSKNNARASAGYVNTRGYVAIQLDGQMYLAHRLAFLYVLGYFPERVDHINGLCADNRWVNLRACTQSQNRMNSDKPRGKNSILGVSWDGERKLWRAYIMDSHLGYFKKQSDAAAVRKAAEKRTFGEFAPRGSR